MPDFDLSADGLGPASVGNISLSEIISALSFALDLTEGARAGHALRSCLLGMRLAREITLSDRDRAGLYYALLLKDIGCSSNAALMSDAFAADERVVKQRFKFIDRQKLGRPNREALSFVWNNVAPESSTWDRLRQISRMLRSDGDLTEEMIQTRCDQGAAILRKFGMDETTCDAVYALDEHWNGRGLPRHLVGIQIPLLARICAVAQHLDLFCTEFGEDRAIQSLTERAGVWFDPELVRAACSLHKRKTLWTWCLPDSDLGLVRSIVVGLDPGYAATLTASDVDVICSGFADVIDAKSSFTFRHAVGVTETAVLVAQRMGLAAERVTVIRRAALLQDIGKLGVSNLILDKVGPLTAAEWESMHRHPTLSAEILSRVRAFEPIALLASQHHEKLDGTGYPRHLTAEDLSLEARILAVSDIFSALMEHRPFRSDFSPADVARILEDDVPHRLDGDCVDAAMSVLDQIAFAPVEQTATVSYCPPPFALDGSAITF